MNPKPPKRSFLVDTIRKIILFGISVGLIYWLFAPDQSSSFHPVTLDDLQGVWTTTHPRYQDRFLQFDDQTVTFGWGNAGAGSYTLTGQTANTEVSAFYTVGAGSYTLTGADVRFVQD